MVEGFQWVLHGRLAGSGLPGLFHDLDADLEWLRAVGVKHIVSLTEEPLRIGTERPFELHHFPIPDMGISTPRKTYQLCRFILAAIENDEPVLVHCRAGLGRTGTVLACCLVSRGASPDDAVAKLRVISQYYIQNSAQEALVRHFSDFLAEEGAAGRLEPSFERWLSAPSTS